MTLFDIFKRRTSAPVARERLQLLLAYERQSRNQPDLVNILREEIMAVISKHVQVDHDDVHIKMDRGERMSTLEIDIQIPNRAPWRARSRAGSATDMCWRSTGRPRPSRRRWPRPRRKSPRGG